MKMSLQKKKNYRSAKKTLDQQAQQGGLTSLEY